MSTILQPQVSRPQRPSEASTARQTLHASIALAGWVLFVWWWAVVLGRVSPSAVRLTALFIGVALAFIVLLTVAWTLHNLNIYRRKGPRTQVRSVPLPWARDRLGRSVAVRSSADQIQTAPIVVVRLEHEGKVYRTTEAFPTWSTAGTASVVPWTEER